MEQGRSKKTDIHIHTQFHNDWILACVWVYALVIEKPYSEAGIELEVD